MAKLRRGEGKPPLLYILMAFLFVLTWFAPLSSSLAREASEELMDREIAREVDLHFMEDYWSEVEEDVEEYFPSLNWREAFHWFQPGEEGLNFQEIPGGLVRFFMGELFLNLRFLGKLLVLAVVAALVKNLQTAFESKNVAWLTRGVLLMVLIGLIMPGFMAAMELARSTVGNMVDFILAFIPVMLILLSSLGSFSAVTLFHPVIIFSINFFSYLISYVVFPLILFTTALALVNTISPGLNLGKLAGFFKDLCSWTLGLMITLFVALVCVKGVTGTVGDAVTLKTAKFLSGSFIPVIGKTLGDAVETVAGASLIFKNGVGLAGLIVLLMICLFPLLKLFVLFFIYRAAAALVQIVGETSLGDCLTAMGNSLMLIIASVAGMTVIFFLAVVIIVASGNALVMLR